MGKFSLAKENPVIIPFGENIGFDLSIWSFNLNQIFGSFNLTTKALKSEIKKGYDLLSDANDLIAKNIKDKARKEIDRFKISDDVSKITSNLKDVVKLLKDTRIVIIYGTAENLLDLETKITSATSQNIQLQSLMRFAISMKFTTLENKEKGTKSVNI